MTTQQTEKTTETPRSDAAILEGYTERSLVSWDFARQLETELTTATAARLDAEGKCAEMRTALQDVSRRAKEFDDEDCPYAVMSYLRSISDRALSTTLGQGWMSPEEVKELEGKLKESERKFAIVNLIYPHLLQCVEVLESAGLGKQGTPNTLLAMVQEATAKLSELEQSLQEKSQLVELMGQREDMASGALKWAMAMEPSPCRCMDFATPPHVCRGHEALAGSDGGEKCPVCGAPEVDAMTPRTTYACGSSDYDQRPGTFKQACSEPATIPAGERAERQCAFS
jgi:hypothetical protein